MMRLIIINWDIVGRSFKRPLESTSLRIKYLIFLSQHNKKTTKNKKKKPLHATCSRKSKKGGGERGNKLNHMGVKTKLEY